MPDITIDDRRLSLLIRYSKRRATIQIRIRSVDQLEITAPFGVSISRIEKLLEERTPWISRHMKRLDAIAANPANKCLTHGAQLLFEGRAHTLVLWPDGGSAARVSLTASEIRVHLPYLVGEDQDPLVCELLRDWYIKTAGKLLIDRTQFWASLIGVSPTKIRLKEQKTRWGSCSRAGSINYNWRIVMAPPEVLDYLVVHELCHMREPNHSAAYWRHVARWLPGYAMHRRWLRRNGNLLTGIL